VLHCGKQEKSRRGKIVIGTYGVRRPKKKKKHAITNPIEVESVLSDKLQKKSKKKAE
jgi:ribosomal small subunit protein bTHX